MQSSVFVQSPFVHFPLSHLPAFVHLPFVHEGLLQSALYAAVDITSVIPPKPPRNLPSASSDKGVIKLSNWDNNPAFFLCNIDFIFYELIIALRRTVPDSIAEFVVQRFDYMYEVAHRRVQRGAPLPLVFGQEYGQIHDVLPHRG